MAEEHSSSTITADESKDRGLFDFMKKKDEEEKPVVKEEEVVVTEFEKLHVSESDCSKIEDAEIKKHGLPEKLHRSDSSSSSSSDEEVEEGGEKRKKKKEKKKKEEDTSVPVEKCDEVGEFPVPVPVPPETAHEPEEKKGFLEKIKEKLPGQTKKTEDVPTPLYKKTEDAPPPAEYPTSTPAETHTPEAEPKEKKGILEKIKEKLPGYHPKTEEDKEKEAH